MYSHANYRPILIVSRHPAAAAFIRAEAPEAAEAPIYESVTPEQVAGAVVYGNLPLALASLAYEVVAVEFSGPPPRGTEYGLEEMRAAGARLAAYQVEQRELRPGLSAAAPDRREET